MSILRWTAVSLASFWMVMVAALPLSAQPATAPESLWSDFNHYVVVARPDLAKAAATQLLSVDPQKLLDAVESAGQVQEADLLQRAEKTAGLQEVAKQLGQRLDQARLARAKDAKRITEDIQKLAGTSRERTNAAARLTAAGQYAVPQLLATLVNDRQDNLHPFVMQALAQVGKPAVYPLSVSLAQLEIRPLTQVAQVLADIGYPMAMPYLKQVIESRPMDANARTILQTAYDRLAARSAATAKLSAAELFQQLARDYYTTGTLTGQTLAAHQQPMLWTYDARTGLIPVTVPASIFHDVLAMQAAQQALTINPKLESALSWWLTANLRREQSLAGQKDPSYPPSYQTAGYYLRVAGPMRQHDVLARALADNDSPLALAAIDALKETAGTEALINRRGTHQPLIQALYYPDARVRIRAALALGNARPTDPFSGSDRLVRVLAEAIRPSGVKYALVLADSQDAANKLAGVVRDAGYQTFSGLVLSALHQEIEAAPAIDLVVIQMSLADTLSTLSAATQDYRLGASSMLAILPAVDQAQVMQRYDRSLRKPYLIASATAREITQAIGNPTQDKTAAAQDNADSLAAVNLLRDLALAQTKVFKISEAQPALIRALNDSRADLAMAASQTLSLLPSDQAQQAIADAALDTKRPASQRLALMGQLAQSATAYGNKLNDVQISAIQTLVKSGQGDMALAAAKVYGALTLPSTQVLGVIR